MSTVVVVKPPAAMAPTVLHSAEQIDRVPPIMTRFLAVAPELYGDDCWPWPGASRGRGYGTVTVRIKGRQVSTGAYRLAFILVIGPLQPGLTLDHLCRSRPCVNPAHLEPVTIRENTLRGAGSSAVKARKVECLAGHPLEGENLRPDAARQGMRQCRACQLAWSRRRYALLLAAAHARGMSFTAYVARYGYSRAVAEASLGTEADAA